MVVLWFGGFCCVVLLQIILVGLGSCVPAGCCYFLCRCFVLCCFVII